MIQSKSLCYKILELNNSCPPSSSPVLMSQEREAQADAEPQASGPSESEVALQEALSTLQQEKDSVTAQYQAQVCTIQAGSQLITNVLECSVIYTEIRLFFKVWPL